MRLVYPILTLCLIALAPATHASAPPAESLRAENKFVPDYIPLQFAGNTGLLASGIGYTFCSNRYHAGLMYGFVPASVAKADVHLLTLKNSFQVYEFEVRGGRLAAYTGLAPILKMGKETFLPAEDRGKYQPHPLHVAVFAGGSFRAKTTSDSNILNRIEVFAETGTVDFFVWYKISQREVKLNNMLSMAVGVKVFLGGRQE